MTDYPKATDYLVNSEPLTVHVDGVGTITFPCGSTIYTGEAMIEGDAFVTAIRLNLGGDAEADSALRLYHVDSEGNATPASELAGTDAGCPECGR
jgi:hypothetical protein